MTTLALGPSWLDPDYLLDSFGIWGLLLIVFAESGLLIGFFLPGDSLLFTAGLLITSKQLDFPLWAAIVLICVAAILGDQAGYMFGKKVGPSLFTRPDSRLFKQENVTKAHDFFEKYGPKSLVLARFVPIVRTFTPIIAGVSGMRYRSFLTYNVIGGILWGAGVTLLGSWLGNIDFVKKNIEPILLLIVLLSVVPIIIEFLRARSQSKKNSRQAEPSAQQQPAYQQPMDDATTQLRRIEEHDPYGNQGGNQGQNEYQGRNEYRGEYRQNDYYGQQPQQPQQPQQQYQQEYPQQGYPEQQQYPQQQDWQPQQQPQQQNGQYPYNQGGY
ncbi:VTT domain-containing protein [Streptomyces phaeoluteigriseus]|uniref:VTT domain-containing protein n=1 Tax=Streptomyces phaeoluteigriseus TaxID=114686 RepID=A0ABY4Z159_9ACTN|nr:VTT domain-containing protein [Streptomyces phaeoluteigriseus]USQ82711.1 VTT domain-containing protein [Streptomyces phaeoluteigriseus]